MLYISEHSIGEVKLWTSNIWLTLVQATSWDVDRAHCVAAAITRFCWVESSVFWATFLALSTRAAAALATAFASCINMSCQKKNIISSQMNKKDEYGEEKKVFIDSSDNDMLHWKLKYEQIWVRIKVYWSESVSSIHVTNDQKPIWKELVQLYEQREKIDYVKYV